MIQKEASLSVSNICSTPYPIIRNMGVEKKDIVKQVYLIILRFNRLLNVSKPMDDEQMTVLALDLVEAFEYDTLEDVILLFKMARNLKFGNIYRVDPPTILSWIPIYMEQKAVEREHLHKQQMAKPLLQMPDEVKKSFDKMLDKVVKRSIASIPISKPQKQTANNNYDIWFEKISGEIPSMTLDELKDLQARTKSDSKMQNLIKNELQERTKI